MMYFDQVLEETDKKDIVESAKYKINIFWPIRIRTNENKSDPGPFGSYSGLMKRI